MIIHYIFLLFFNWDFFAFNYLLFFSCSIELVLWLPSWYRYICLVVLCVVFCENIEYIVILIKGKIKRRKLTNNL